jgi:glutaredoxin
VDYFNVTADAGHMKTMLKHSNGARKVPVIIDGAKVTIGFEGGS